METRALRPRVIVPRGEPPHAPGQRQRHVGVARGLGAIDREERSPRALRALRQLAADQLEPLARVGLALEIPLGARVLDRGRLLLGNRWPARDRFATRARAHRLA